MSNRAWRRRRSQWWTRREGQWHVLDPRTDQPTKRPHRMRSKAHWTYITRLRIKRYRKVLDAMRMDP